ncbi:MAG: glutamate-ammonia-ligase adenylyltransferase, partial [Phycisphaerae bacterium]|nr:glutamate-ammonia-ligase adenylyltransferase [Phycisphaerae bacterium]
QFKDQEIFLIDLDHLLTPGSNFQTFSRRLTRLAEAVVQASAELAFTGLVAEHGAPRTADGHPAPWAVFGLGKLGGRALGYASDIELLFVYDGPGQTDGKQPMDNAQFFQRLVNDTTHLVRAKREGIFEVDLRLRPHGKDGPLASSADAFERYFAPQGPRHEMERLALVRLRAIGGDAKLGRRIEAARDQLLYDTNGLDLGALREIRHRAYEEKATGPTFNAKQGCGGLLDMESSVQMMQIRFGGDHPAVRGPYIHAAVKALGEAGALDAHEAAAMIQAYEFLRRLINGLRMLRGNATDLSLPSDQSPQYRHLARRIGYTRRPDLPSSQQLEFDLAQHTATVRCFVARHLGRDLLLKSAKLNLADLVLSDDLGPAEHQAILAPLKFRDTAAAAEKLGAMAGAAKQRRVFARLALQAGDLIAAETDPDRTLDRWAQVAKRLPDPLAHYRVLLEDHRRLGVVIALLGRSPAVTDLLTRLPQLVQWIASPEHLLDPDHLAAIDRALQIQGVSP